ncbi:aminotransferase class V-fold PLP-dependent enzyme [Amycolatopsis jejuensis]|uniref:aminotransferase class V-fold PLP-dependent enzyme n=1 Tax=Amycolatopsis jejuensis TaxID=330084 RepID=UPI0005242D21|nr:aminotransferase class V-fold PLP-dependent enzyme [Amycolatopsis jejuensis]
MPDPRSGEVAPAGVLAAHFPGRPQEARYFDTASVGLVPAAVREAVGRCYSALEHGRLGTAQLNRRIAQAYELLAAEFGVTVPETAVASSTSDAVAAITRLIPWRSGDEIIVLEQDFPSIVMPWYHAGPGARVRKVAPLAGDERLTPLLAAIGRNTRVVAVSHVNSTTGTRLDLVALGRACREAGVLLVVDGAQAGGCLPAEAEHVDFYVCTGYKWLLAGFGVAAVVGRKETLRHLGIRAGHSFSAALAYGYFNVPGVCALGAALEVRQQIGTEWITARAGELAARIHRGCVSLGLPPVAPIERTGTLVCLDTAFDPEAATARLAAQGVHVAARGSRLRISGHFYNSDEDVEVLLASLAGLARQHPRHRP